MKSKESPKIVHLKSKKEANDWLYSSARMMEIVIDVDNYQKWLLSKKDARQNESFFEGYRVASGLIFGVIVDQLSSSYLLDLEKDFRMRRLNFVGADIDDLPNYSPSILILKMLNERYKRIFKSETWGDLKESFVDVNLIVNEILTVFNKSISSDSQIEKHQLLDIVTLNYMHYFFDVDEWARPMFWVHNVNTKVTPNRLNIREFQGYITAYEFIISSLKLDKSIIKDYQDIEAQLDKYQNKSKKFFVDKMDSIFGTHTRNGDTEMTPWMSFHLLMSDKWGSYSKYINKLLGTDFFESPFVVSKIMKIKLKLADRDFDGPEYFNKTDYNSIKKQLDYQLFWYNFSLVDSCGYGTFNGVPAFISILYGYSKLRTKNGNKSPIRVVIFKHPENDLKDENRYSFGALVELYGTISDSSGWLIFNECATDFSGQGSIFERQAYQIIEELESKGLVDVSTYVVDLRVFKKYLRENRFESKIAEEESVLSSFDVEGPATSDFEQMSTSPKEDRDDQSDAANEMVKLEKRIFLAKDIIANMRHCNRQISRITNSDIPFFIINTDLVFQFIFASKNEEDFGTRIGYLERSFDSDCRPIKRVLNHISPEIENYKSILTLAEWNKQKNDNRIPSKVFETWTNINWLRNALPQFHEDTKNRFIDVLQFFEIEWPLDYELFWEKVELSFSKSLIDFIKVMNLPNNNIQRSKKVMNKRPYSRE